MRSGLATSLLLLAACGDAALVAADAGGAADARAGADAAPEHSLAEFLPPLPVPSGGAQTVFAGPVTQATARELIPGPAQTGMVGSSRVDLQACKLEYSIVSPK